MKRMTIQFSKTRSFAIHLSIQHSNQREMNKSDCIVYFVIYIQIIFTLSVVNNPAVTTYRPSIELTVVCLALV